MRGRYRILLGAAAGVGKTYRMLQEGHQAKSEGVDVVIGYLEPHARPDTCALRQTGSRRFPAVGSSIAASSSRRWTSTPSSERAPELALIDELAHTNAPGSTNAKRYEDIDEVLAAGIDVISTVNVQHLESLNDAIFELDRRPRARDLPRRRPRRGRRGRPRRPDTGGASATSPGRQDLCAGQGRRGAHELLPTSTGSRRCVSSRCVRSPRTSRLAATRPCSTRMASARSPSASSRS